MRYALVLIAGLGLAFAGCAPRPHTPPATVSGTVRLDGEPLPGGRVTFYGPRPEAVQTFPVEEDGSYSVPGAPLGRCRVAVTRPTPPPVSSRVREEPPPGPADAPALPRPEVPVPRDVPARYGDPETSGLEVVVAPGEQAVDLELHSAGKVAAKPGSRVGLEVGDLAPEIEGDGLDLRPLRLSDFRGKVVLLYFWGDWCSLCRKQDPHVRSLAGRFAGRPFAVLGVNSDPDWTTLRARKHPAPWRSWWDRGIDGPVAVAWRVQGWPSFFAIDHRGVIRAKNVWGPELGDVLERLVGEVPGAASAPADARAVPPMRFGE